MSSTWQTKWAKQAYWSNNSLKGSVLHNPLLIHNHHIWSPLSVLSLHFGLWSPESPGLLCSHLYACISGKKVSWAWLVPQQSLRLTHLMDWGWHVHSSPSCGSISFTISTHNTENSPTWHHSLAAGEKWVRSANNDGDQDRDNDEDDEEQEEGDSDQYIYSFTFNHRLWYMYARGLCILNI